MNRELNPFQFSLSCLMAFMGLWALIAFSFVAAARLPSDISFIPLPIAVYAVKFFLVAYRIRRFGSGIIFGGMAIAFTLLCWAVANHAYTELEHPEIVLPIALFGVPTVTLLFDMRAARRGQAPSLRFFIMRSIVELIVVNPVWWTLCGFGAVLAGWVSI